MAINIFNTLGRKIEIFKPIKKGKAGIYACGPTVYNYAHIGNLRTYVFEDILKRVLIYNGYKVEHIMNITDVGHLTSDSDTGEDKMEKGAAREGKTAWEIAEFYTQAFKKDLSELNILPPDIMPKATDHIKEQISLIKKLQKKGFTYKTDDGVYFDTTKLPDYGKLANLQNQKLKAGARIDMGGKKNINDFALWKLSVPKGDKLFSNSIKKRQMEWKSPWGVGFPGWHIECSAMSEKFLGQPFDIHCGGIDHVHIHHTNEIAQSEAANGKPLANYWMHGEFLISGTEKMAKSSENYLTLEKIKEKGFLPLAYRYLLLQTHYRKQLTFSWDALEAAQKGLIHLYKSFDAIPDERETSDEETFLQEFLTTVNNDLDTPAALAEVWQAIRQERISKKHLLKFDKIFGLKLGEYVEETIKLPIEAEKLVNQRDETRKNKNWEDSDQLRKQLEGMGYKVEDSKEGTKVSKK